ncbi:MAG: hypothetical protein QXO32_04950 [Candidatus Bathyarchaeia archaeon]
MVHTITYAVFRSFEGLQCTVQVTSDECKFIAEARASYSVDKH